MRAGLARGGDLSAGGARKRRALRRGALTCGGVVLAFALLSPYLVMLLTAVKSASELRITPPRLLPLRWQPGIFLDVVADPDDGRVPVIARECLEALGNQLQGLKAQILEFDRRINAWHRSNETSRRLDDLPGVGPALDDGQR